MSTVVNPNRLRFSANLKPKANGQTRRGGESERNPTDASGVYLACYFFGGLIGTAVLGQIFDRFGWAACVGGIALALAAAACLAVRLRL